MRKDLKALEQNLKASKKFLNNYKKSQILRLSVGSQTGVRGQKFDDGSHEEINININRSKDLYSKAEKSGVLVIDE